jgi:hypothetical protein
MLCVGRAHEADDVYFREVCFVGEFDDEGKLSTGSLLGEQCNVLQLPNSSKVQGFCLSSDAQAGADSKYDVRVAFQPNSRVYGKDIVKAVWRAEKKLSFTFVEGPKRSSFQYYEGLPIIRPGLYVGHYENMYGKFGCECLLVEYKTFSLSSGMQAWVDIQEQVFRGTAQSDPQNIFASMKAAVVDSGAQEVMFVFGRKVLFLIYSTL